MSQATAAPGSTIGAPSVSRDTAVVGGRGTRVRRRTRLLRPILMLGGIAIVIVGSLYYWLSSGRFVSIDDAYVRAAKVSISTDVSGPVAEVAVHEGQQVKRGDLLFRLDPHQFQIAVEGAKAKLDETALNLNAMKRDYVRMQRDIATRDAMVQSDQARFARYASLVGRGDVPRQDYDDARFKMASDQAALESAKQVAAVQLAKLGGNADVDVTTLPAYQQAQSDLAEAQRQLAHTTVRAPFDGVVTQVDQVQPGMYLSANTGAFGLVSTDRVWVDASPKETELTWVKPGDPVEVTVDTYPGRVWKGVVDSIAPASGSEFSILPAQNASGNWVKVVQRIGLRVRVDRTADEPPLRAGMSVVVDIDTGHKRTLADLY
jgi:membrane fusion protein, multidrug efflux system